MSSLLWRGNGHDYGLYERWEFLGLPLLHDLVGVCV
jgi:hypothetical protein